LRLSSPQSIFFLSVLIKLSYLNSINFILNFALVITTSVSVDKLNNLLSKDNRKSSSRLLTLRVIFVVSGITSGLAFKLCGAMGVITKLPACGIITGPPQLSE
jgi:uncharacterized metal-binding protein